MRANANPTAGTGRRVPVQIAVMAALALMLALGAGPAQAQTGGVPDAAAEQDPVEKVTEALHKRGYRILLMERTFLGRLRIIAETADHRRELVINPGTGEVLRDYAVQLRDGDGPSAPGSAGGSGGAGGTAVADIPGPPPTTEALSVGVTLGGSMAPETVTTRSLEMPSFGDPGQMVVPDALVME